MNGIKQYFSSLAKDGDSPVPVSRLDGKRIVSNMESVMKSVRKKKSKKKRTSGDGDITDISNILSCSLNLLSPKKTPRSLEVPEEVVEIEDQENIEDQEKKNVFEVMMKKRRLPEEFTQEDSARKSKKAKKSPEIREEVAKPEETRKKSRRKKLFELEVETVDYPRRDKQKSPEEEPQGAQGVEEAPNNTRKKSKKPRKKKEVAQEEEKPSSEPEIVEEKPIRKKKSNKPAKEAPEAPKSPPEEDLPLNERLLRSKKRPRRPEVVESEQIVIESDTDSTQRSPRRSCRRKILTYSLEVSLLDSDSSPEKPKASRKVSKEIICVDNYSPGKAVKLAPIFVKPQKAEVNPEAMRAKQEFLMSGIPEKMRQTIEKQRATEEFELNQFPEISHITQIDKDPLVGAISWPEKEIKVKFREESEVMCSGNPLISLIDRNFPHSSTEVIRNELRGRNNLPENEKSLILKRFTKNFGDFPTKKAFSFFRKRFEASGEAESDLFADKYRPGGFQEFLVNSSATEELKNFLESFHSDKFSSTFESLNDPEDSTSSFANSCCVVLSGPSGSGKTASVTALAAELNFNVLEINAGMKRSGKRVLQELQEATQSHKVERKSFSLILVEDAEITFDQDEGFVGAVAQIVADSKRPVILTTSEPNCSHLERFIAMNVIHFIAPGPEEISKWLTLMALAEGVHLEATEVQNLYNFNGQDLRRTTNELEFFVRTAEVPGELNRGIREEGLRNSSFDTLWSNSGQWLKAGEAEGAEVKEFADFYELISAAEVIRERADEESEWILEGAMRKRGIGMESYDHFQRPRRVERSLLSSFTNNKISCVDYEPILRNICRSEQEKASRERKSSRFYHYLRQVVSNASNELFIEQCKIFS